MKQFHIYGAACLFILLLLPVGRAAADNFICPSELATKQLAMDTPPGWKANTDIVAKTDLTNIELFGGPPDQGADTINPWTSGEGKKTYSSWKLKPGQPLWMVCDYGDTAVTLMRKMPEGLHECHYDMGKTDHSNTIDCK